MKQQIILYIKLALFILLSVYLVDYVYSEIDLGGMIFGVYFMFNIPLALLELLLSVYFFTRKIKWLQVISIIGFIIAGLTLIPPSILYLIF